MRWRPALALVLSLGLLALCTCRPTTPTTATDPFATAGGEQTVEEALGPGGHFVVFRPEPLVGRRAVVVFSVGTRGSPGDYRALLTHWASRGLVVVAGDEGMQREGDQAIAALDWLLAESTREGSVFEGHLDAAHVAAAGHSQGGNAAIHVALRDPRVTTVLAIEPGEGRLGGAPRADERGLRVPTLYLCGERDRLVPPAQCATRFANTPADAWVAVLRGAGHFAPVGREAGAGDPTLRAWTTRWLLARLGDAEAAAGFDGADWSLARDPAWRDVDRHGRAEPAPEDM